MRPFMLFAFALIVASPATHAQTTDSLLEQGSITINNIAFTYKKVLRKNDFEGQKLFQLYTGNKKLLEHTLRCKEADCNSMCIELGDYSITGTSIILYSYWAWKGGCCGLPYGARKQVYNITNETGGGEFLLDTSLIFLEVYKNNLSAMSSQQAAQYMASTEKEYHATFVRGSAATSLIATVKQKLAQQIARETKGWDKDRLGHRI